jgi:Mg2+-importing ATPase
MGTSVVSGTAKAIVKRTGMNTYFGSMAKELFKNRPQNAFQLGVRRISWLFFIIMACMVPPVLLLQGIFHQNWGDAFMFGLSVAVGLTPEMLPMIVNATLARGAILMSRKKCIVKNLDSIINMGGMKRVFIIEMKNTLEKIQAIYYFI